MTIFTIAAVVIVIGWFAFTALFWASSFKEDKQVHPIYSGVTRNPMRQDEPVKEKKSNHCECNIAGDRPKRALFLKKGKTFCARCEKAVNLCPICGALRDLGVRSPCTCESGALQLNGNMADPRHRRKAAG